MYRESILRISSMEWKNLFTTIFGRMVCHLTKDLLREKFAIKCLDGVILFFVGYREASIFNGNIE